MFIGVRKRIRRRKFIVLFTRISSYVCRRISRIRELRYKGRSSPDIWMSRSNRMAHIYRSMYFAIFRRERVSSDGGEGIGGLKMPVILRVFIYACLISRGHWIYRRLSFYEGYRYVCRGINFAPILISLLLFTPFETTSELFSVGILRVRADSCAI